MKYFYLFIFFFAFSIFGMAQSCLPDGIIFSSQSQIDSFSINYPGCTVIEGSVVFNGNSIDNLNGLSEITSVGGLFVSQTRLQNFEGLNNLHEIVGDLTLGRYLNTFNADRQSIFTSSMVSFSGLEKLETIGGNLSIAGTNLTDFSELISLQSIGGGINLISVDLKNFKGLENVVYLKYLRLGVSGSYNDNASYFLIGQMNLVDFDGLNGLKRIDGPFDVIASDKLVNFKGLERLEYVERIHLFANNNLVSFDGLASLKTINGDFKIGDELPYYIRNYFYFNHKLSNYYPSFTYGNPKLIGFDGLNSLESIKGQLMVARENQIENFQGISTLKNVGSISVSSPHILNLDGLESVRNLDFLKIWSNIFSLTGSVSQKNPIQNIEGLKSLKNVFGSVELSNLSDLESLEGMNSLENIGGSLICLNLDTLESLQGLNALKTIDGDFILGDAVQIPSFGAGSGPWEPSYINQGNNSLKNLMGLENLESVKKFQIVFNDKLKSFSGLENLKFVKNLSIGHYRKTHLAGTDIYSGNENLVNIKALSNAVIQDTLLIYGNSILNSLDGLHNISTDIKNISVVSNHELFDCNILCALGDRVDVFLKDNKTGCNRLDELNCSDLNRLQIPIAGTYKEDFIIVNYVDWVFNGILDANCGTQTYDGHQGTDFSLPSFKAMDDGVDVMAADSGIVIDIHDGEFDKNTEWNVSLGLGNYVAIAHDGKINTYYGHLKKNSLEVVVGDKVSVSQKLGEVGSSGNSTGPHLHFEMWYDSTQLIDPFHGACGNATTYWENELPYDDSFWVWETGFLNYKPTLAELYRRSDEVSGYNVAIDTKATHWKLIHGVRNGDVEKYKWITPSGLVWFEFEHEIEQDYWYYYTWAYININEEMELGEWSCEYYLNDSLVDTNKFDVDRSGSTTSVDSSDLSWNFSSDNQLNIYASKGLLDNITLWTADGRRIYDEDGILKRKVSMNLNISNGFYIARVELNDGQVKILKIIR